MRRLLSLSPFLLLAQCGEGDPPPQPAPKRAAKAEAAPPASAPAPSAEGQAAREQGEGAAVMLRRYYDHIEAGQYDAAWEMRGGKAEGAEAFARNFAGYELYRVSLGQPSEPVTSGGWSFVEVPIMITGRLKGGEGFGSAGSITLRRASGAPGATARQKEWHIYTG